MPYPPADPDEGWAWEQFVDAAQKLTVDANGNHPGETGFNPEQIFTYCAAFDNIYQGWTFYPFVLSNGGQVVTEDGTRLLLDSHEASQHGACRSGMHRLQAMNLKRRGHPAAAPFPTNSSTRQHPTPG